MDNLGESLPLSGSVDSTDDNYLETRCIGLQGTHCISGSGIGVVVATGNKYCQADERAQNRHNYFGT